MYFPNDKEMSLSVLPVQSMSAPAGSLIGRVCMVTGATGALGKATANAFAQRGARVVLVSRDEARGRAVVASVRQSSGAGSVEALQGDLSDLRSVRNLAKSFGDAHDRLDVLVNAAAVFARKRIETGDGFELMFVTNFLGPFLLTNLLVPALRAGAPSRVITISAPTTSKPPEQAAEAVAYLASSPHLEGFTGRFFKGTQPSESNAYSRDSKVQKRLWKEGERLVGESFPEA